MNTRMKKKLLSFLLSMTMTFSLAMISYTKAASENDIQGEYAEKISIVKGIGILDRADAYLDQESISRADLAEILFHMLRCGDRSSQSARHYLDVPYNHARYVEIESISAAGLMCGVSDKEFHPDDPVTYNQAIKVMVCALNYQTIAEKSGGFPYGYLSVAGTKKLTKSMKSFDGNSSITGQDMAVLIYNTIHATMMETGEITEKHLEVVEGDTDILKKYHDIILVEGVEDSNSETSLYGDEECAEGKIKIKSNEYTYEHTEDYLGYYVSAYVKDTDQNEDYDTIVFMLPSESENTSLRVESEDLVSYDSLAYQYEADKRTKKAKLSKDVSVFYNGKLMKPYVDALMIPEYGYIEFVSNNRDSDYNVVFIHDWDIIAADTVSAANGIISDLTYKDKLLYIDFDNDDLKYTFFDGETPISFDRIKRGDVLTVEKSYDGMLVKIFRSDKTVKGTLTSKGEDTLTIEGESYEIVPGRYNSPDFRIGNSGNYVLDISGRVAGYVADDISTWLYGIVTKCFISDDEDINRLHVKVYTTMGVEESYGTADKFRLDGERMKTDHEANTDYAIDRMTENEVNVIRFKKNADDQITDIDTLTYNAGKEDKKSLFRILDKKNYWYNGSAYCFGGKMIISSAKIVKVDPELTGEIKEDYQLLKPGSIKGNQSYMAECFGLGNDFLKPEFVIIHGSVGKGGSVDDTQKWMMVESCESEVNEDEEIMDVVSGMWKGYIQRVMFEDGVLKSQLKRGDIIRFSQNEKGYITTYEKVYDAEKDSLGYGGTIYPGGGTGGEDFFAGIGYVWRNEDGQIAVTYDKNYLGPNLPQDYAVWDISTTPIYIYDQTSKRGLDVTVGSMNDLLGYDVAGMNCSKIVINAHWFMTTEVFVIK